VRERTRSRKKGRRERRKKKEEERGGRKRKKRSRKRRKKRSRKRRRSRKKKDESTVSFKDVGRKERLLSFFLPRPPKPPLLALPMTRSHAAASAALLACSVLLCAASSAQVGESEKEGFSMSFFLLVQCTARHRCTRCFPFFPASRVQHRALTVSFLGISRRTYFQQFERVQIQVLKSEDTCSVARGKKTKPLLPRNGTAEGMAPPSSTKPISSFARRTGGGIFAPFIL
jgi:hypothetical protein